MKQKALCPVRLIKTSGSQSDVRTIIVETLTGSLMEIDGCATSRWKLFSVSDDGLNVILRCALREEKTNVAAVCLLDLRICVKLDLTEVKFQFKIPDPLPYSVSDLFQICTEDYLRTALTGWNEELSGS